MAEHDSQTPPALRVVTGGRYADWDAIYRDNATWVYRTIFARVGNQPDAEDLTAEVFLAALGPLRISASVPEVRAYLRATARTVLAAHWRATLGREITSIEDIAEASESRADNRHGRQAGARRVGSAARQLPPDPGAAVLGGMLDQGLRDSDGCQRGQRQGPATPRPAVGGTS